MAKAENQKLKALYVAKYFLEYSDENHSVSAGDIVDYLRDEYNISTERRSIYRDISVLRDEFGFDIDGGQGGKYRLLSRQLEIDDLRIIAECVQATKFISEPKSREIVEALTQFCSIYQAEQLRNDIYLCDRIKSMQKGTLNIISIINAAMALRRDGKPHTPQKICFNYLKHTIKNINATIEKYNGEKYVVSPYRLLINDGNYYLLAYSDKDREIRTYRIDRMKNVCLVDAPRAGADEFAAIDIKTYTTRVFSMMPGKPARVSIRFDNSLLDTAIERFGTTTAFYREDGENNFVVSADVDVSEQFFAWICLFGSKARIISPLSAVKSMKLYLTSILENY